MNKMEQYAGVLRLITPVLLAFVLFILNNMNSNLNLLNKNVFNHESRISNVETTTRIYHKGLTP